MNSRTISPKTYYIVIIEGVFQDGSTISTLNSHPCIASEKFEKRSLDQRIAELERLITIDTVMKHSAIFEQLHDNNLKPNLVRYYIQRIKKHNSKRNQEWISYLGKKFVCSRAVPNVDDSVKKQTYYVYKHYYFDKEHNEVVFYVGKGMGDAKGSDSRIYSHARNRYWKAIVDKLKEDQISYYSEPVKFFDSETEALNYELQLQKEYWDKGQCLGCADLRRRYGYLEGEVIE